jgi:hypothetical protein
MLRRSVFLWLIGAVACQGQSGFDVATGPLTSAPGSVSPPTPTEEPERDVCAELAAPEPGPTPVRRLNRTEYNNTVRDLLGTTLRPADRFPPDETALGFDNNAGVLGVTSLLAEAYLEAAEQLARAAAGNLTQLTGCDAAAKGEPTCAAEFIDRFGRRAFRRPLEAAERERLTKVFEWGRTNRDYATGIRLVVTTALQSSAFLYRVDFGEAPIGTEQWVALTPYELATRLSYLLWNTMPDDALLDAAEAGGLRTAADLEAHARRMLKDPKARQAVANFHRQWLKLDAAQAASKSSTAFPEYTAAIPNLLQEETSRLMDFAFWEGDGTVAEALTAPYTFVNQELAAYYGLTGVAGTSFQKVAVDPARHGGVLMHGSFLAPAAHPDQTSPVLRGKFIRQQLFCQALPPPPDNAMVELPAFNPDLTTRERFAAHSTDPACAGCHRLMDPLGLGLENFDPIGRWRSTENGKDIDPSGEVLQTRDADGPFVGAQALASRLAGSAEVSDCMVSHWFRFGYGRTETEQDRCTLSKLKSGLAGAGGNLRELLVLLTQTDTFRYRRVAR